MGLLDLVTGPVLDIINKIIPTPMTAEQKSQAQLALQQLQQNEEFKQMDDALAASAQQTNINQAEASNPNMFVAGWRPFVGWVCGGGLAYQYLADPLLSWGAAIAHLPVPPSLDMSTLITMLGGLLGLGGMRTYEKINNAQGNH
jgi:hypothetical protein